MPQLSAAPRTISRRFIRTLRASAARIAFIAAAFVLTSCQMVVHAPAVAPDVDRVGFPENYDTDYSVFYEFDRPDNRTARVIYANEQAASVQPGQPFPYGSVLVMEVHRTVRDDAGNVVLDDNGRFQREDLAGIFVMRKEPGFGAKYGVLRNGEWEYVAYRPDGTHSAPPQNTQSCAACHMEAGLGRDWVFGANRFFGDHPAAEAPTTQDNGENTVNVVDYGFHAPTITVTVGSEVTWVNNDVVFHTVSADDFTWSSSTFRPTLSYRRTFEEAGEFDYFCALHPSMRGKVVVTAE